MPCFGSTLRNWFRYFPALTGRGYQRMFLPYTAVWPGGDSPCREGEEGSLGGKCLDWNGIRGCKKSWLVCDRFIS